MCKPMKHSFSSRDHFTVYYRHWFALVLCDVIMFNHRVGPILLVKADVTL